MTDENEAQNSTTQLTSRLPIIWRTFSPIDNLPDVIA